MPRGGGDACRHDSIVSIRRENLMPYSAYLCAIMPSQIVAAHLLSTPFALGFHQRSCLYGLGSSLGPHIAGASRMSIDGRRLTLMWLLRHTESEDHREQERDSDDSDDSGEDSGLTTTSPLPPPPLSTMKKESQKATSVSNSDKRIPGCFFRGVVIVLIVISGG